MDAPVTRIPLLRKDVPHSYTRRRLENISGGTRTDFRSPDMTNTEHVGISPHDRLLASSSDDPNRLAMTGYAGAVYYADVSLGPQSYHLIVDTGSTDTWVSCYVYDAARCMSACPSAALNITYGSGTVCVSTEIMPVKLGSLIVRDYVVGIALSPVVRPGNDNGLLLGESQGIIGLGYPRLATINSPTGYFVKFLKSFSVYLEPRDAAYGSFLLLNGVDEDFIQQNGLVPYSLPLKKLTHWTIGMTGFHINGLPDAIAPCTSSGDGSCDAIVDTGSTLVVLPRRVYNIFVSNVMVPAGCHESQLPESRGMYVCARTVKLPTLQFTFGEMNFYLEMEDYIQRAGNLLYVEIQGSGSLQGLEETWVLGGTFLKKYYSSYQVSRAVVFYCVEGTTCDRNGTAAVHAGDSALVTAPGLSGSAAGAGAVSSTNSSFGPDNATSSHATDAPGLPHDVNGKNTSSGAIVSTTSSGGTSHTATIAIIATVAGLALVVAIVFVVRKLYRKRQNHQEESLAGLEIEAVGDSTTTGSAYASAVALTPTPAEAK